MNRPRIQCNPKNVAISDRGDAQMKGTIYPVIPAMSRVVETAVTALSRGLYGSFLYRSAEAISTIIQKIIWRRISTIA